MADVDDRATEIEMAERDHLIAAALRANEKTRAADAAARLARGGVSECLNCGERLAGDARFCDRHCRDDYDRRRRATLIGGKTPQPEIPES